MNTPSAETLMTVDSIARSSRRAALLGLLGILLVLTAIVYAVLQLRALETQRVELRANLESLRAEAARYELRLNGLRSELSVAHNESERSNRELNVVREQLARARGSQSAARAAISAFKAGRLEDAVSLYDEALGADPENAYLQNLRAYALFRLHKIDAALEGQQRSVAIDPTYAWGYFDLARFLCASSPPRFDEARTAVARAMELRPAMKKIMQDDGEFQRICRYQRP